MNYVPSTARLHIFLHQPTDIAWNELKIVFSLSSPNDPPKEEDRFMYTSSVYIHVGVTGIPHAVQYFASPQEHTAVRDTSFPFQTLSTHRRIYELQLSLALF
jgi:hypothetical protein